MLRIRHGTLLNIKQQQVAADIKSDFYNNDINT